MVTTIALYLRVNGQKGVRFDGDCILIEIIPLRCTCQLVVPKHGSAWSTAHKWVQYSRHQGRVHRSAEDVIVENSRLLR